jgi:SAM-dependent methyltransferase
VQPRKDDVFAPEIEYSEAIWRILVCPDCGGKLDPRGSVGSCADCDAIYPRSATGQLDLRLRAPKAVSVEATLERERSAQVVCHPLAANAEADPSLARSGTATGNVNAAAASWLLPVRGDGAPVLDLGCGSQPLRPLIEAARFTYIGLDYDDPASHLLGDAHALPFANGTFEQVLTIAAMEYFQYPLVAAREAYRVLKPGGRFVGTMGHLIPYLEGTYYNHTHRGVVTTLETAGFEFERLMAPMDWSALEAIAELGLFPGMPGRLAHATVKPVDWFSKLWWKFGRRVRPSRSDANELARCASFFFFVASKPS